MDSYDPIQLVNDAVAFDDSQFGKHYLKRLQDARERELKTAMDSRLSDSQRAHAASRAATVQAELDYFETARTVQNDPSLMQRMRAKLRGKEKPDPIV